MLAHFSQVFLSLNEMCWFDLPPAIPIYLHNDNHVEPERGISMAAILWLLYIIFTLDEMRSVMTAIIFNYSCVFLSWFLLGDANEQSQRGAGLSYGRRRRRVSSKYEKNVPEKNE